MTSLKQELDRQQQINYDNNWQILRLKTLQRWHSKRKSLLKVVDFNHYIIWLRQGEWLVMKKLMEMASNYCVQSNDEKMYVFNYEKARVIRHSLHEYKITSRCGDFKSVASVYWFTLKQNTVWFESGLVVLIPVFISVKAVRLNEEFSQG